MVQTKCVSTLSKSREILELYWGRICLYQADPSVRLGTPCYSPFDATLAVCSTLYCIAVLRWCYRSLFVNDYRPGCKQLLVRTWNYYWSEGEWLVLYPCAPYHYPPPPLGKCFVSLRDIRGEARDWSQPPSTPCICFLLLLELFPILIETRKLTLVSRSRCAENQVLHIATTSIRLLCYYTAG